MQQEEMLRYLRALNDELQARQAKGEICLYGGAVMCLVFHARPSTKDVEAVFEPTGVIREAASAVAAQFHLPEDWLNDGVKGFVVQHEREIFAVWSHLTVYVAEPDYLFAMKALAARLDGTDNADLRYLIRVLGLRSPDEAFAILERYYPRQRIKPATQFFLEEVFETQ